MLAEHIRRLCSVFEGAFPLDNPMPFLLDQAIEAVYRDLGWTPETVYTDETALKFPTMSMLYTGNGTLKLEDETETEIAKCESVCLRLDPISKAQDHAHVIINTLAKGIHNSHTICILTTSCLIMFPLPARRATPFPAKRPPFRFPRRPRPMRRAGSTR